LLLLHLRFLSLLSALSWFHLWLLSFSP
jgi:hypothetical protein